MTEQPLPLFFPEALQDIKVLSPRLRTLGFTLADLTWLRNVELASHALRTAASPPMTVEHIVLTVADSDPLSLAGSFMLHPAPGGQQAVLYTPNGGLQKHDNPQAVLRALEDSLKDAAARKDLLCFLPIAQREAFTVDTPFTLQREVIEGLVFDHQEQQLTQSQRTNQSQMLEQLGQLPTLTHLLNQLLDSALRKTFPELDQSATRVSFSGENRLSTWRQVDSMPLSDVLLDFYLHQAWPSGEVRAYSNPRLALTPDDPSRPRQWEIAIKQIASGLPPLLAGQLKMYWEAAVGTTGSRRDFFAQAMCDKARVDLLLKRQSAIITPEQSQTLIKLIERTNAELSFKADDLLPEKVRIWEYRDHFAELAGGLMLSSSSSAYLYIQSMGLQVLDDYADLKQTLQSMATSPGNEDEFYNLLTLQERDLFLGFDTPEVSGEPVFEPVFRGMVNDIIAKQRSSITYALETCRNSEGGIDARALFDQALDVRAMIDSALLESATTVRWSTRPLISGEHRPSMVLAERAKLELKSLQSVQSSIQSQTAAQPEASVSQQRTYLDSLKAELGHAMSVGIRSEAKLRVLIKTLQYNEKAIIDTVLNPDKSTRRQRMALHGFRPDAWSLTLQSPDKMELIPLANCFLLTERGGLDPAHSGHAILWTPAQGLESFSSIASAKTELGHRLQNQGRRLALLENLPRPCHPAHRAYTLGPFRLIEGNVLQDRQQSAIEQYLANRTHTLSLKLSTARQHADFELHKTSPTPLNLQRAISICEAIVTRQSLPVWLGAAPEHEVVRHVELLEQYRRSIDSGKDYLHDLKPFGEHAREQLTMLLEKRFPNNRLNPDQLTVTPNLALAGPAQTLTDFALNPKHVLQEIGFKVTSTVTQTLPTGLDSSEIRKLLLQLDFKTFYQPLLAKALAGDTQEVMARQQRFIQQLPWQMLLHAHALHLQGTLSERSFSLIQQVLDMPDALARATVTGANAIVRPLELVITRGAAAVKALGLYLIGEPANGPQILYAPYSRHLGIKEFESEARVLDLINHPGPMQDLVLRRLPDPHKATYENLWASSTETDIRLARNPIEGNLLLQWFDDNKNLLLHLLGSQFQRNAQDDWTALTSLLSKGIHVGIEYLPGKLAIPVMLWKSFNAFMQSAEALQDHHWKRALSTFINGVAQMVALGRLWHESGASTAQPVVHSGPLVEAPVVAADAADIDPTAPGRTLLHPFEVTTVALNTLQAKATDGTYLETKTRHRYAPIDGKVFRVEKFGVAPRIVMDKLQGPYLRNRGAIWVLDPDKHTVHYGKAMSRLHNKYQTQRAARRFINVEARGMDAIRRLYPLEAQMIVQALDLARLYAFNSLHNLAQLKTSSAGTRLEAFFKDFFGVSTVDTTLLKKLHDTLVPLCEALVDPTLDRLDHNRFVVGWNRYPSEGLIAFVLDKDQQNKVHFTERFFSQGLSEYAGALTQPFDVVAHAQAATLIHEFSHLFSRTIDIAYLEARRPFSDLISTITAQHSRLKQTQEQFQREALSIHTPLEELFSYWNQELNEWQDFDEIPEAKHLSDEIKRLTGAEDMDQARRAFHDRVSPHRRIDTILRNADSVARLVCEMGRQLDPVPSPVIQPA